MSWDEWEGAHQARAARKQRNRDAMRNIAKRMKIEDRVEYSNDGMCLLDGRVYYYAQSKKARVKGQRQFYQMKGFKHFVEVFG